ncbi:MAG: alpha/beta hydrolase [Pseudomonadota bacterium]
MSRVRGGSDWLADKQLYANPTYVVQILKLLDQLGLAQVDWIGTSMGGLIGMAIAATAPARIRRLVINDIARSSRRRRWRALRAIWWSSMPGRRSRRPNGISARMPRRSVR